MDNDFLIGSFLIYLDFLAKDAVTISPPITTMTLRNWVSVAISGTPVIVQKGK